MLLGYLQVAVKMLLDNQTYKDVMKTTKNRLAAKGQRQGGLVDPQKCTTEDTLDYGQYITLQTHLQGSASAEEIRDRSIFAFLYASIGRADEGRMIYLADMVKPRAMKCLGKLTKASTLLKLPNTCNSERCAAQRQMGKHLLALFLRHLRAIDVREQ